MMFQFIWRHMGFSSATKVLVCDTIRPLTNHSVNVTNESPKINPKTVGKLKYGNCKNTSDEIFNMGDSIRMDHEYKDYKGIYVLLRM